MCGTGRWERGRRSKRPCQVWERDKTLGFMNGSLFARFTERRASRRKLTVNEEYRPTHIIL